MRSHVDHVSTGAYPLSEPIQRVGDRARPPPLNATACGCSVASSAPTEGFSEGVNPPSEACEGGGLELEKVRDSGGGGVGGDVAHSESRPTVFVPGFFGAFF